MPTKRPSSQLKIYVVFWKDSKGKTKTHSTLWCFTKKEATEKAIQLQETYFKPYKYVVESIKLFKVYPLRKVIEQYYSK